MDHQQVPESVRRLRERIRQIEPKPMTSYADEHRKRHGAEFMRRAVLSSIRIK